MPVLALAPRENHAAVSQYSASVSALPGVAVAASTSLTAISQAATAPAQAEKSDPYPPNDALSPRQIGAVIASILGFILLLALLWYFCYPRRRRYDPDGSFRKDAPSPIPRPSHRPAGPPRRGPRLDGPIPIPPPPPPGPFPPAPQNSGHRGPRQGGPNAPPPDHIPPGPVPPGPHRSQHGGQNPPPPPPPPPEPVPPGPARPGPRRPRRGGQNLPPPPASALPGATPQGPVRPGPQGSGHRGHNPLPPPDPVPPGPVTAHQRPMTHVPQGLPLTTIERPLVQELYGNASLFKRGKQKFLSRPKKKLGGKKKSYKRVEKRKRSSSSRPQRNADRYHLPYSEGQAEAGVDFGIEYGAGGESEVGEHAVPGQYRTDDEAETESESETGVDIHVRPGRHQAVQIVA